MTSAAKRRKKRKRDGSGSEDYVERNKETKSAAFMVSGDCNIWNYFLLSAFRRMDYGFSGL